MVRSRRAAGVFVGCHDVPVLELEPLLRGRLVLGTRPGALVLSLVADREVEISRAELDLLLTLPGDRWAEVADSPLLASLREKRLVVAEDDADARRRDDALKDAEWSAYAALFHARGRWRDFVPEVDPDADTADVVDRFVAEAGPPPPHFHSRADACRVDELPPPSPPDGELLDVLRARRTTRAYGDAPLPLADLSVVLDTVFGCRGYDEIAPGYVSLRKTSPSGGALHAIEAYLLVQNVENLDAGVYHYRVRDHALALLEPLARAEAADLADLFTCGQVFPRAAHVLVVLAARFRRSFWKYRENERAYAVLLMEAGHLSQTLYLVCTRLGLGAFVTAAINGANVDERLGLDGFEEGALAICGFGVPALVTPPWLERDFARYDAVAARREAL